MLRPGQSIVLCVLALLTLGVVMVNSAGMSVDPDKAVTLTSVFFNRTTAYMALALMAMAFAANLPIARLRLAAPALIADEPQDMLALVKSLWPLWAAVGAMIAVMALVYMPGLGREVNKSDRWIGVGIPGVGEVRAQPSEIAKWGLVALMAWYGWRYSGRMNRFWRGLVPALLAVGLVAAFIAKEDLGTGVLVASAAAVVLVAAGAKFWHLAALAPIGLAGIASLIWVSPYRWQRLTAFWDPYADPRDTGYHMIQSMAAVANGNVFGQGLGHGLNKFGYLPEDTTDFLFAVICEELGVVGAALVAFMYAGLLLACVQVIRHERHQALKLLGVGVLATIGLQAAINLFVVTGLGPTKGIALPLLSSGGTGWILTAASLGLLVAMDRSHAAAELAGVELEDGAPPMRQMIEPRPMSPVVVPVMVAAALAGEASGATTQRQEAATNVAPSPEVAEFEEVSDDADQTEETDDAMADAHVSASGAESAVEPPALDIEAGIEGELQTAADSEGSQESPEESEVAGSSASAAAESIDLPLFAQAAEKVPLEVIISESAKHWPRTLDAARLEAALPAEDESADKELNGASDDDGEIGADPR